MVCKWQVEIDDYANRVLAKHWPAVPRFRDIREFPNESVERVDVICGGFPCQDISYAGLGAGLDGERSGLFFEAIRVVQQLRPRVLVLENVAALLSRGLDRILGTLAAIGFDAEWHCVPASAVGAPHIRDRIFVIAYSSGTSRRVSDTNSDSIRQFGQRERMQHEQSGQDVAAHDGELGKPIERTNRGRFTEQPELHSEHVSDTQGDRCRQGRAGRTAGPGSWEEDAADVADAGREGSSKRQGQRAYAAIAGGSWWATEPDVGRVANGIPKRVDRLRGLGNAVVPQVAEFIGRRVVQILEESNASLG